MNRLFPAAALAVAALLSACSEPPTPTHFKVRLDNVASFQHLKSRVFSTKVGASAPGPIAPGEGYEITFTAGRGQFLQFATMFGQSNDWFFAPVAGGIPLYEGNSPV